MTWRVPSLALPVPGRSLKPEELAAYESIRLFCERASDVASSFALGEDNAGAVAEICSRLDGMPLALELAAARVGALSPAQIAERLGDSPRRPDGREPVGARPPADAQGHAELESRAADRCRARALPPPRRLRRELPAGGRGGGRGGCRASKSARSPTSWDDSSTSRWWWPRRTPTATAIACSSRCDSTRGSALPRRARR